MIFITEKLSIPENELFFTFSRSSSPGGQNVNKVATKATLRFDVAHSPSLTARQRQLIFERLARRIDKNGNMQVVSYRYRTQGQNRKATVDKFTELLAEAIKEIKPRKKTKTPRSVARKRLARKKQRSVIKKKRSGNFSWDD
ncbi:MAG: aminoacyl-tRNA hydrolase [Desulfobulbaceae bacterium]|nr:aminoacyl-tRNA hydrolase [Desulfobulbaceae bacterium]